VTISEISQAEGLSVPNVAKMMRLLRSGGLVKSIRGQAGGFTLAGAAGRISLTQVLYMLRGSFVWAGVLRESCRRRGGLPAPT